MAENIITQKRCPDCKQIKPISEFGKNRSKKDGLNGLCKWCAKVRLNKYRLTDAGKESVRRTEARRAETRRANYVRKPKAPPKDRRTRELRYQFSKYQMTLQDFDRMWEAQGWVCAICKALPNEKRLQIDHDHACCSREGSCGKCVRGLICSTCNRGLAAFRDNEAFLGSAITYLAAHRSKPPQD